MKKRTQTQKLPSTGRIGWDVYSTTNIELTAAIVALLSVEPEIVYGGRGIASFMFWMNDRVLDVILQFESGNLPCDCKTLLNTRNRLFKQIKEGGK